MSLRRWTVAPCPHWAARFAALRQDVDASNAAAAKRRLARVEFHAARMRAHAASIARQDALLTDTYA